MRSTLLTLCLILALTSCSGIGIVADLGVLQAKPEGSVALTDAGNISNIEDFTNDLADSFGITDDVSTPYGRVEISGLIATFTFSGFIYGDNSNGSLQNPYGTLPQGSGVDSDYSLTNLKGAATLDLINLGFARIAPGVCLNILEVSTKSEVTSNPALNEDRSTLLTIPQVFLQAEVDLGYVDLVVEGGWMEASVSDINGRLIDLEAIFRIRPIDHVEVFAGYRWLDLDADGIQDDQAFDNDITFSGFTFGLGLSL